MNTRRDRAESGGAGVKGLVSRVLADFWRHSCVTHGAALAFYALFVLVPIPILVVSWVSVLVDGDLARADIVEVLRALAGDQTAALLGQELRTASQLDGEGLTRLFALASLVFGATAFFVELHDILNKIWGGVGGGFDWRRFARSRILSFVMVAASGVVLVVLALAGAIARSLGDRLTEVLPVVAPVLGVGGLVASLVVVWALFAVVLRYLPDADVTFRGVWLGALATTLLFAGGNELIGLYLRYTSLATVYGAAGSLVLTLIWIYYSAVAFLLGAELTRALGERRAPPSPRG